MICDKDLSYKTSAIASWTRNGMLFFKLPQVSGFYTKSLWFSHFLCNLNLHHIRLEELEILENQSNVNLAHSAIGFYGLNDRLPSAKQSVKTGAVINSIANFDGSLSAKPLAIHALALTVLLGGKFHQLYELVVLHTNWFW